MAYYILKTKELAYDLITASSDKQFNIEGFDTAKIVVNDNHAKAYERNNQMRRTFANHSE
ncbi:hypothetical protein [Dyadobacter sp. 3J3]|uniref:hypothetical protein n=1 Tax=Dyadobacter sp. 3J3 TaxID=2606600 RepID=UPI0013599F01|nr:hypothetical protein [Dyadobacter sp. 3J3]